MKKTFDCVAMKRRGAEIIYRQVVDMTIPQQLAFWRDRTRALKQRQKFVRTAGSSRKPKPIAPGNHGGMSQRVKRQNY
jgi:hypothetical protein